MPSAHKARLGVNPRLRNVAIVAHANHGKTPLVGVLFCQSRVCHQTRWVAERVMDTQRPCARNAASQYLATHVRSQCLTDTRGAGIMTHMCAGWES